VVRAGARPFFVDIDPETYNLDPKEIRRLIEAECRFEPVTKQLIHRQTATVIRAIMPVHLYGQSADMDPILEIAREHRLVVIEDGAQAIGAGYFSSDRGKSMRAGSMGEFGCFSFFPTKNLGGFGDGGMVTTNDENLAERLRVLRVHGSKPKYYHQLVGGNFRLDAVQAAVLLVKLRYLDNWTAQRREHAASYNSLFQESGLVEKGFITPPRAVWEKSAEVIDVTPQSATGNSNSAIHIPNPKSHIFPHIYNQYVIRAQGRDELRGYLAEQGIGTEIYYPLALHRQECFANLGYHQNDFSESDRATAETMAIPVFPELEPAQLSYVVDKIVAFYTATWSHQEV
jgi:dTDP-4-amino-4,6-dideoxygalactose transaminase